MCFRVKVEVGLFAMTREKGGHKKRQRDYRAQRQVDGRMGTREPVKVLF